jgi:Uncharacterised nucleotidyltransferase
MDPVAWARVGALADRAPGLSALRHHKLQLLAAGRMRARGEAVPSGLVEDERRAALLALTAPAVLRRVRAACDGPLVLFKGLEVASRWPQPQWRPSGDIDLLVLDAPAVQSALLAAGFVEAAGPDPDTYDELHHCCPLVLPGLPITVEVHRQPHWCDEHPPAVAEIVAAAQPSAVGIAGVLAPRPDHHAVLLAAHAWAHEPLDRIGQLADVAALLAACDRAAAGRVADAWGVGRVWRATVEAVDQILMENPRRVPIWKRHLLDARERTVLEDHATRLVAPIAAAPRSRAPLAFLGATRDILRPAMDEAWPAKVGRSVQAVRHAAWTRQQHLEALDVPAREAEDILDVR